MDQQCSAIVKHWTMSNVQNGHNSCPQPKSPPVSRLINDRLSVNQMLPQLINIPHRVLIDPLLYHCQDSVINRTEIGYDKVWLLATNQLNNCVHMLCCWNLSTFFTFIFIKNVLYALMENLLRCMFAKNYQHECLVWHSYCKNKMLQFCTCCTWCMSTLWYKKLNGELEWSNLLTNQPTVNRHYILPGSQLPFQPQNTTAIRPLPNYAAWWQRCVWTTCLESLNYM